MTKRKATGRALMVVTGALHASGGIAALNRLVLRACSDEGYRVELFSLTETKSDLDERYGPAEQVVYRSFGGHKVRFTRSIWDSLLRSRYDLIVADHVNVAAVLAPWDMLGAIRYIVWLCGVEVFPPKPDLEGDLGLRAATKRLAISSHTKTQVSRRYPTHPIQVCELALDPVRHAAALPALPRNTSAEPLHMACVAGETQAAGARMLLHVGRMATAEQYKGQDVLIRAFPALAQRWPELQLALVGDGEDRTRLFGLARELPAELQRRIFMPGNVSDALLEDLYGHAFAYTMPSRGEGFGLVYLEAMSRALPCIGGKTDATPTVVRDGETGILVADPGSPAQVTDAIERLLQSPALARSMGEKGYALVRSQYLYPQFRGRFLEAIAES